MWKLCLSSFLFIAAFVAADDSFARFYSNTGFFFSLLAVEDGYVVAGDYFSPETNSSGILTMKVNLAGKILWKQVYRSSFTVQGLQMISTSDGGFAITGKRDSSPTGPTDILLLKLNSKGSLQWVKKYFTYGWDSGERAVQTKDGGFLILGTSDSNLALLRVDRLGNLVWTKSWEAGFPEPIALLATDDGKFLSAIVTSEGMMLLKFDATGEILWKQGIQSVSANQLTHITATSDGGFALTGIFYPPDNNQQMFVARFNRTGKILWKKAFTAGGWLEASAIAQNSGGSLVIVGNTFPPNQGIKAFIMSISLLGRLEWARRFGGEEMASANLIWPLTKDQLLVSGPSPGYSFGHELAFLLKLDSGGNAVGCPLIESETMKTIASPSLNVFNPNLYSRNPPEFIATTPEMHSFIPAISGRFICK